MKMLKIRKWQQTKAGAFVSKTSVIPRLTIVYC